MTIPMKGSEGYDREDVLERSKDYDYYWVVCRDSQVPKSWPSGRVTKRSHNLIEISGLSSKLNGNAVTSYIHILQTRAKVILLKSNTIENISNKPFMQSKLANKTKRKKKHLTVQQNRHLRRSTSERLYPPS
jgi:hypothetical protein